MTGSGWQRKQTENEMMTWAALPPAQTSRLASKPITLGESRPLLGVTGQTTRRQAHTRRRARRLNPHSSHFQALPDFSSSVLLSDLQAGRKKGKHNPDLFLRALSAAVKHDARM